MVKTILGVILIFIFGAFLGFAGIKQEKLYNKIIMLLFAGVTFLLGIGILIENVTFILIGVGFYFGVLPAVLGFSYIKEPFLYSIKGEGTYLNAVFDHETHKVGKLYALNFKVTTKGHSMSCRSSDTYIMKYINKQFHVNQRYTVWVNRKDLNKVKYRRFEGFILGVVFFTLGCFIVLAFCSAIFL